MAVKDNVTTTSQFTIAAREVDFVQRFGLNWDALREIMGIMRPIKKQAGTKLTAYKVSVDGGLQGGISVSEGDEIPFTKMKVEPVAFADIGIAKHAKSVTIEAVAAYGPVVAVQRTDEEFLNEITNNILIDFYESLNSGSTIHAESSWQMALAMAKARVLDKFASINRTVTEVVGFANILDAYSYIGAAEISIQTKFGISYVENFMGYRTLFLLPAKYIGIGTVIAVPSENINLYYIDPSDSEYAQLGLNYRVDGETNLIGVHVEGDYSRATGDMTAIYGIKLWPEYLDGIAVEIVDATGTLGTLTVSSSAGTASGDTAISVTESKGAGNTYVYKVGTAAVDVVYGQLCKSGWTAWDGTSDITAATGKVLTLVEIDANKRAQAAGSATVTAKT